MTKYYIDISEELANKLQNVSNDKIVEALSDLAEAEIAVDELSAYDSVAEIESDESLSKVEKKQLKIKAHRRSDISTR